MHKKRYWENIEKLHRKQEQKGLEKYGMLLEQNTELTAEERVQHIQEELIDALMYCEHLKSSTGKYTVHEYQQQALRTANIETFAEPENQLLNGILGLAGEAGEVVDLVKKYKYQGHILDIRHLAEEIGDVCWYIVLLCNSIGYDLETVLKMNIEKLKNRYPDGFEAERSLHREEKE